MLYQSLSRDNHQLGINSNRIIQLVRTLKWLSRFYVVVSAVMLAFAIVKSSSLLGVAALVFLSAAFALEFVKKTLAKKASKALRSSGRPFGRHHRETVRGTV